MVSAVLEHQRQAIAEVHPPETLQLGDVVARFPTRELVGVADADIAAVNLGRALGRHQDLHQGEDARRRLWQVGQSGGWSNT